jgi:predicted phage replisome organizer
MAEYSKEKLFYLKLNKDFFDKHYIKILETQDNGDKYVLFLIKLMCESISHNGYLRYNESIPYDEKMLSAVTNTDIDVVRVAIKLFQDMEIVEFTENKTIFIPCVQQLTCSTTEGAERKRQQVEKRWKKGGKSSTIVKSIEYRDKSIEYRDTNVSNKGIYKEENKNKEIEIDDEDEKLSTICENECGNVENSLSDDEIKRIIKTKWLDD